jgi:capsular exopolysaccharide synthesis family protein
VNGSPTPPAAEGGETVLRPLLRAIRAHRLLVALTVVAALAGATAFLVLRAPNYEATANVLVNPLPQDDSTFLGIELLRDSGDPTRTVQTAAALIETPRAAFLTARSLGEGWTVEEVLDNISISPEGETNVLAVTATDDTAAGAVELANEFVSSALDVRRRSLMRGVDEAIERIEASESQTSEVNELESRRLSRLREIQRSGDPTFVFSQRAIPPSSPSQAGAALVIFLALLAGLTIGSGTALLLELFDRRLRDEEDVREIYDLPVLARIPLLRRRQLPPWDSSHLMPAQVGERFRTLALQFELRRSDHRSVMVTSASQGDGKTTCAVQLAIAMATSGKSVILVDCDLRKPGLEAALGIVDQAPPRAGSGARIVDLAIPAPAVENLRVVTAQAVAGGDGILDALRNRLGRLLGEARSQADFTIVDTPPLGEVGDALQIASHVDDIVLVARTGNTERSSLASVASLFEQSGYEPAGYVVLESLRATQSSYYASYGAAQPKVEGPTASSPPATQA